MQLGGASKGGVEGLQILFFTIMCKLVNKALQGGIRQTKSCRIKGYKGSEYLSTPPPQKTLTARWKKQHSQ